jgi:cytochrome P450
MFSLLCRAQSEEGEMLTDDEIVDHMVFIMVAAHDTTTSAMTMMAYELARNPDWQDECRAEIMAESDSALSFDSLKRLEKLDWTFKEALRLYPPIGVIPRRALREFEFGGYRIPANTTIMVNVAFIQRIPEWWDNPEKFDPLRFSPERAEHRRHPYSWFPFSGGAHQCSGMYMALMQAKAFYSLLLRKYRLRLTDGYKMKFRQFPMPRPLDGLPLELVSLDAN